VSADFVARHPAFNADGAKALQLRRRTIDLLLVEKEKNTSEYFQMAVKAAMRATRQCVPPPCVFFDMWPGVLTSVPPLLSLAPS
jgi:hypothetical protein